MHHEYLRTILHFGYVLGEWKLKVRGADPLVSVRSWDVLSSGQEIVATVGNELMARSVAQRLRGATGR